MTLKYRSYWAVATAGVVATAAALTVPGIVGGGRASAAGQSFAVPCPAADQVTPALDTNLVANPGAADYVPLASIGGPAGNAANVPDCWTVSSALAAPGAVVSVYSDSDVSASDSDPGNSGYLFWGGHDYDGSAPSGTQTFSTQTIPLTSINPGGLPFELSAWLGGDTTEADEATVGVTFEDASGDTLGHASIGPVTEAQRAGRTVLLQRSWFGTVPPRATQAVVTITTTGDGTGLHGFASDVDLQVGPGARPTSPILQTYTYPTGSGGALYKPAGVSASGGTVYVSNTGDNVLSAIDKYGNTTVVAGSLERYGDLGDGGPPTSAALAHPGGTAVDSKGDIFIADSADNAVREITPDGRIHRFAGAGWGGLLDHPEAVAVDKAGDVFVSDTYANRVLEVLPGGRVVDYAGTGRPAYAGDGRPAGRAELDEPTGLATDAAGDLYIADSANNVVREVSAKTHLITTVAGDYASDQADGGTGGYSGDGGPATSARLYDPQGVAVDGAGDLFIADTFNNAIREVTPAGIITTVVNSARADGAAPAAGGETSGVAPTASDLNTPYAVAYDPSTNALYIADTSNSAVAEVLGLAQH